jgi:predicted ATPase
MLTRFRVRDYKCLADVDIPLTPLHVVIGDNESGKTSLLESMYALFRTASMPLAEAFPGVWTGAELVRHGTDQTIVALSVDLQSGSRIRYDLSLCFHADRQVTIVSETVCGGGLASPYGLSSYIDETAIQQAQGRDLQYLSSPGDPAVLAQLVAAVRDSCSNAHLYRLDPRMMAMPTVVGAQREFRLDMDGFGLARLLDELLGHDPSRFLEVEKDFCQYFPQFRHVRIEPAMAAWRKYTDAATYEVVQAPGKAIWFELASGGAVRAEQASDGAILFLGYLALAHLPEPPRLLLIEEPETGIYPKRLQQVIRMLREWVEEGGKAPQIIMTTHSPYVLSTFEPEEVTFMTIDSDGTRKARPLRDAPNIRDRMGDEFYLGELWYNLDEQELFGSG